MKYIRELNASDEAALKEGYFYSEDKAKQACDFAEKYVMPSAGFAPNKPIKLLDWQRRDISWLYGWVNKFNQRRHTSAYYTASKQNGKSLLASFCGLYELLCGNDPSPKGISVATTKKTAEIIYRNIAWSIKNNEELSDW